MTARSEINSGRLRRARVPITAEAPRTLSEGPSINELANTTVRRILVVDDNRDAAESLAMLLKLAGHETHTAHDGLEAVETAAQMRPDLILLDISLPKINGGVSLGRKFPLIERPPSLVPYTPKKRPDTLRCRGE